MGLHTPTCRVYVAAASSEPDRARIAMDLVRSNPRMMLAYDWLADIEGEDTPDDQLSDEDRLMYAEVDLRGVLEADVLWLLSPEKATKGAWVEFGYAMGAGIPTIVVSGASSKAVIFCAKGREYRLDSEAFSAIDRFAREGELG